jgi:DNA-binding IclR family transcriptional regulator
MEPRAARQSDRRLIQSVDRSIRLLNAISLSRQQLSVAELAAACELSRSTAWRLVSTLEHHGLIERDDVSQRYAIGYALVRLAAGKTDHAILIRAARPALERIAADTKETVNLSVATQAGAPSSASTRSTRSLLSASTGSTIRCPGTARRPASSTWRFCRRLNSTLTWPRLRSTQ